ncbi:hypothetical protein [Snuella lapsa]|uniref:Uncharacterized protein n=1 Tax=Snuella lapsa TaxID=870481 RepID=A0ABP6Y9D1_9FLAO
MKRDRSVMHYNRKTLRGTLIIIMLLISSFKSSSQESMVVDADITDLSALIGSKKYSFYITDLEDVPDKIKYNLDSYLKIILGELYVNAVFKEGYISDLDGYFQENPNTFDRGWVITKYQFVFDLKKPEIGIVNYPIKVDVDEYGQVIECNWPRKWFGKVNDFVERSKIKAKAMKWAEKNTLNSTDFDVDLIYDSGNNTMSWKFRFPKERPDFSGSYQMLEIDWSNNEILKEYTIYTTISH